MVSSKYGPTERVGLVEHREQLELAVAQEALDRDLDPRHVLLDEHRSVGDGADPGDGGARRVGVVDADHALAPRAVDAASRPRGRRQSGRGRRRTNRRVAAPPPVRERGPHRRLVAGGGDRGGRVVGEAEPLARGGGGQDTLVVDRHHRVDRGPSVERHDGVGGRPRGRRAAPPRPGRPSPAASAWRLLRADDHLDAETGRPPARNRAPGRWRWAAGGGPGARTYHGGHGPTSCTITDEARATVLDVRNAESRPRLARALGGGERRAGRRLHLPDVFRPTAELGDDVLIQHHDDLSVAIPADSVELLRGCHARVQRRHGDAEPEPALPPACARRRPAGRRPLGRGAAAGDPGARGADQPRDRRRTAGTPSWSRSRTRSPTCACPADARAAAWPSVTLSQGIEVAILDSVPEITEVVDVTDHASGDNPYYEAAKK